MKGYWSLRKTNSNCYKEALWSFKNTTKLTTEDRAEADEYGISPGKYRIISEIIEKYPSYTIEDLKDKSMAELKELLTKNKGNKK